jgi:hypothetical protein
MITKDKLLKLVADLVERLVEYGCDTDTIVETLKYYGFTNVQIKELYLLDYRVGNNE